MLSLKDLHMDEVVQITQENMIGLMCRWNDFTDGVHVISGDNCFRTQSSVPHPLFNNILKTNFEDDKQNLVRALIQDYQNLNLPFLWRVWDTDTPEDIGRILLENGAEKIQSTTLMAIDLETFHPLSDLLPGLTIRPVRNEKDASNFTKCSSAAFEIPELLSDLISEIMVKQDQNLENFVGYMNGQPVSTSTIFYGNGVAGIYNVGTLPEFHGKGIGLEMMTTILLKAKLDGYQTAILHSTPAGLPLYEKLGFNKYGEMRQYLFF